MDSTILLFFQDFERDTLVRGDRYLKRMMRPLYDRISHRQKVSGFSLWYALLVRALTDSGYTVRLNDFDLARKHPNHPVGLVGYPSILSNWTLPNPAILGPGLFDHPSLAPTLMNDVRFRCYILTCDWMFDVFQNAYARSNCAKWFAGIDTVRDWPDLSTHKKTTDVIIYDKIRWNRENLVPQLLTNITSYLSKHGITYEIVRYGKYDHMTYRSILARSKMMIFLCEHETQGMAYQEALASNLPIVAWDPGFWCDPLCEKLTLGRISTTSVPYFDDRCGAKFACASEFDSVFESVWIALSRFRPREFVRDRLSLDESARIYSSLYFSAAQNCRMTARTVVPERGTKEIDGVARARQDAE